MGTDCPEQEQCSPEVPASVQGSELFSEVVILSPFVPGTLSVCVLGSYLHLLSCFLLMDSLACRFPGQSNALTRI